MRPIRKIVVVGANGAMGSGSGAIFALAGLQTTFLARTLEKAEQGRTRAEQLAKGKLTPGSIAVGTYDADLARCVRECDLVFEAVAEDYACKREIYARIDDAMGLDTIIGTVSSGLSIASLCAERREEFRRQFLGIHLFNPPTAITGCELIPHDDTDPQVVDAVRELLSDMLGRAVVECNDTPAFAGNRIGFKVLNEIATLAEEHGVAYMDQLVGSHTGRALAPLATIDLVGWDVHRAIVDNLHETTDDEAHDSFRLPEYMKRGIAAGHLGRKTRDKGGFFKVSGKGPDAVHYVLDPKTFEYRPLAQVMPPMPTFIEKMKGAIRGGRYPEALDAMCRAEGKDADLLRRVMLGYVSYALGRVGEVVKLPRDVDRIMGFGFNWAPPSLIVDSIGAARTVELLEQLDLAVPDVIAEAASQAKPLFDDPAVDGSRFFIAA
jgi:3-hydroxyacyl-CoA dehydrogenase